MIEIGYPANLVQGLATPRRRGPQIYATEEMVQKLAAQNKRGSATTRLLLYDAKIRQRILAFLAGPTETSTPTKHGAAQ